MPTRVSSPAARGRGLAARRRHLARWSLRVVAVAYVLAAHQAHASVIVNAPKSLGLTNSLVGWWTFDGKDMAGTAPATPYAMDKSGNGNRGTLTNGLLKAVGKFGQGLQLDGVDDYVTIPDNDNLDSATNFSVSFRLKLSHLTVGNGWKFLHKANGSSPFSSYDMDFFTDNLVRFHVFNTAGSSFCRVY
jgi:hypothetical protein